MMRCRAIAAGLAALALSAGAMAQTRPAKKQAAPSRPASAAGLEFADENDPTLPRRGSEEDCRAWRAEYARSQACFARYRNATGGIKAEAFRACGPEVRDPSPECGIRRLP